MFRRRGFAGDRRVWGCPQLSPRFFFGPGGLTASWSADDPNVVLAYLDGAGEQLTNGDFESGDPPDDWAAGGGATLSAQAGARTGGSGTQVMRVTIPIADADGQGQQNALTVGARYRVTGWARGDGTNGKPTITPPAGAWTGTTSNTWQQFSVDFVATVTSLRLHCEGNVATEDYAEWDDVSCVEIPRASHQPSQPLPPVEQLTNGDFETGDPPTGWAPISAATLSAQAGARTGGSGAQVMRIAILAADAWGYAAQTTLAVGTRYRAVGWYRGDGVNGRPRFGTQVTSGISIGTTSNTWQYFDVTFIADHTVAYLTCNGDLATADYAEFDDVSVVPVDLPLIQDTAAIQPALEPAGTAWAYESVLYDGVDEYSTCDAVAASFSGDDKPCTIVIAMQAVSRTANDRAWGFGNSADNDSRFHVYDNGTNWNAYRKDDAGGGDLENGGVATSTNRFVHSYVFSGTTLSTYVNSAVDINAAAHDVGVVTLDRFTLGANRLAGAAQEFSNIRYGQFLIGTDLRNRPGLERWTYRKYPWS